MQDITIAISGMSCGHCLNAVNRALSQVEGIELRSVRMGQADLRVQDPSAIQRVKAAVAAAGYQIETVTGA